MSKIKLQTDYKHYALFELTTHDNTVKGATVDGLTVVDVWRYDCRYQYNNGLEKYQDNEFYRLTLSDDTYKYVYCKKPYYTIETTHSITHCCKYSEYFKVFKNTLITDFDELMTEDLQLGQLIEINEYEPPQEITDIKIIY